MTWNQRLAHGAVANVRAFAERLQDDAVELLRLTVKLSTAHPRAWSEEDRFAATRVAEAMMNIEAGARKARLELERAVKLKPGRCAKMNE